ncbi:ImmA/IrrE family metallo-endopeptidase [Sporolactobacillus sp. KGMB 08714]|uniref:ImmA/IrrE family metallo-endopeptidase n=1 Tax=Sporolactobacillus sp. KGMB 08714 TaxID=3064704 RepID=UPI002FBE0A50
MDGLYVAKPLSRRNIREIVMFIRRLFDLNKAEPFPIMRFLESCMSEIDENFNYEIVPIEQMPDKYAVTYPEEHLIKIRQDVYDRACDGSHLDRFTIAHEIGHYILHQPAKVAFARSINGKTKIPAFKEPEWQANTFAGELLAPPDLIKGMSIPEVSIHFNVSPKVAEIQLEHLIK